MSLKSEQEVVNREYDGGEWSNIITSGGNQSVVTGSGRLHGIMFNAAPTSAGRIFDGTTSAGSTIASWPASLAAGTFYRYNLKYSTGLVVSAGSADTDITVIYFK